MLFFSGQSKILSYSLGQLFAGAHELSTSINWILTFFIYCCSFLFVSVSFTLVCLVLLRRLCFLSCFYFSSVHPSFTIFKQVLIFPFWLSSDARAVCFTMLLSSLHEPSRSFLYCHSFFCAVSISGFSSGAMKVLGGTFGV